MFVQFTDILVGNDKAIAHMSNLLKTDTDKGLAH